MVGQASGDPEECGGFRLSRLGIGAARCTYVFSVIYYTYSLSAGVLCSSNGMISLKVCVSEGGVRGPSAAGNDLYGAYGSSNYKATFRKYTLHAVLHKERG